MTALHIRGVCPHDCPDTCGIVTEVEDGRAVKVYGDPEHPVAKGWLCAKVRPYLDHVYHPDRVLLSVTPRGTEGERPLRAHHVGGSSRRDRRSLEGDNRPGRCRGDPPLQLQRHTGIGADDGGERSAVEPARGQPAAAEHLRGGGGVRRRGDARKALEPAVCRRRPQQAGGDLGTQPGKHRRRTSCLSFGKRNTAAARSSSSILGGRLTAQSADHHIAPLPGSDGALALGLANVIVSEGLHDEKLARRAHDRLAGAARAAGGLSAAGGWRS